MQSIFFHYRGRTLVHVRVYFVWEPAGWPTFFDENL